MAKNRDYRFVGHYGSDEGLLEKAFTEAHKTYKEHGLMYKMGFEKAPAITTVDMAKTWMSEGHPFACDHFEEVCANAPKVLEAGRKAGVPVFHITIGYVDKQQWDFPRQDRRIPVSTLGINSEWLEIDPKLKPLPEEPTICKKYASNFFETHLAQTLNSLGADILIVIGATSCARICHTIMDSTGYGPKTIVPEGTVGDRVPGMIEWNPLDIEAKFIDVVLVDEVVEYLEGIDSNIYAKREGSMDQ